MISSADFSAFGFDINIVVMIPPPGMVTPTITPAGGEFAKSQQVILTGPDGYQIYYTIDGSDPTEQGILYSAPFAISNTTTVLASACNPLINFWSSIVSASFTLIPTIKSIYNVTLAELLPPGMADDPEIASICAAFDAMNQMVVPQISAVSVLDNIGHQPSDVTDLLAVEQRTPYYNQALSLDVRQALVAGTGKLNSIKGTKAAVEQAVTQAFGSSTMQEWFEYGGEPGHFRMLVVDFPNSDQQIGEINRAIAATQRLSSQLDAVLVTAPTTSTTMYLGETFSLGLIVNTVMQN